MNTAKSTSGLNQKQIDEFESDGFLLINDFFNNEELNKFAKNVDAAVQFRTADDNRKLSSKTAYEQTFTQCMRLWEDHPKVSAFTFHPKLCAAAAALLNTDCVRLWHDQALYKEPGGRKTDAHLDFPFWPVDKTDLVSVWIPFQDVDKNGGMMSYVKSSHKSGLLDYADIGQLHGGEPVSILEDPKISGLPLIPVKAKKGSVIFHHACTVHAADTNETNETRRVMTMAYMKDGLKRKEHNIPYFSLDRDDIKIDEKIKGPGHPIAWPRRSSKLPNPPETLGPKTGFGSSENNKFK